MLYSCTVVEAVQTSCYFKVKCNSGEAELCAVGFGLCRANTLTPTTSRQPLHVAHDHVFLLPPSCCCLTTLLLRRQLQWLGCTSCKLGLPICRLIKGRHRYTQLAVTWCACASQLETGWLMAGSRGSNLGWAVEVPQGSAGRRSPPTASDSHLRGSNAQGSGYTRLRNDLSCSIQWFT